MNFKQGVFVIGIRLVLVIGIQLVLVIGIQTDYLVIGIQLVIRELAIRMVSKRFLIIPSIQI